MPALQGYGECLSDNICRQYFINCKAYYSDFFHE